MTGVPPFEKIRGKVHSINMAGRGANSQMLTIVVNGNDGKPASAWVGCSEQPGDTTCYPWIFSGYLDTALAALRSDRDIEMLFYSIPDAHGKPQDIITALTIFR